MVANDGASLSEALGDAYDPAGLDIPKFPSARAARQQADGVAYDVVLTVPRAAGVPMDYDVAQEVASPRQEPVMASPVYSEEAGSESPLSAVAKVDAFGPFGGFGFFSDSKICWFSCGCEVYGFGPFPLVYARFGPGENKIY
ncbi:hypothetical protein FOL47_003466 [Perkinsus chesapeaki]|uniref:Uncharacterized protein n=1 Tax=Perkinsus chesapeaki TaxID=330153 RepID=A0A7J6KNW6_PERCH|nr:hypothetical protein FOL47_003466 [Perkinsus chesapeaki]